MSSMARLRVRGPATRFGSSMKVSSIVRAVLRLVLGTGQILGANSEPLVFQLLKVSQAIPKVLESLPPTKKNRLNDKTPTLS